MDSATWLKQVKSSGIRCKNFKGQPWLIHKLQYFMHTCIHANLYILNDNSGSGKCSILEAQLINGMIKKNSIVPAPLPQKMLGLSQLHLVRYWGLRPLPKNFGGRDIAPCQPTTNYK